MQIFVFFFLSSSLFFISILHIYWALGGLWPGKNKQDLIDKVFGRGTEFPSAFACLFVAFGLILAAIVPFLWINRESFQFNDTANVILKILGIFLFFIFMIRGIIGYFSIVTKYWNSVFIFYTKSIYNPLCIFIGCGFLYLILFSN